jgi:hypothetical protein
MRFRGANKKGSPVALGDPLPRGRERFRNVQSGDIRLEHDADRVIDDEKCPASLSLAVPCHDVFRHRRAVSFASRGRLARDALVR